MYTVTSVMYRLNDPEEIFENVCEILRKKDPNFAKEEQQYFDAVKNLHEAIGDSVLPRASEYITAKKQKFCAELVYLVWLGFQQNLECFQNPVKTMFLKMDSKDFFRERRMHTLLEVEKALITVRAFKEKLQQVASEQIYLTDGIDEFMCYLQNAGYKLAHYFGFLLANHFLYYLIPEYTGDPATMVQYTRVVYQYLHLHVKVLE